MRTITFALAVIFFIIIEGTVSFFDIGLKPDFLLILLVFCALMEGPVSGLKVGLIIGLVEDLLGGKYFGIHMVTKMLTGLIIGFLEPKIFKENYLVPIVTVFLGTFLNEFLFVFFGNIIGIDLLWKNSFLFHIIPLSVYHAILALFIYVPFYKIYVSHWLNKER